MSTTVLKEPVTKVVTVGAKPKNGIAIVNGDGTLTDHNGNTIKYSKVVSGRSSAYTGGGYTSTGKPAAVGLVAVNPKIIRMERECILHPRTARPSTAMQSLRIPAAA